MPAALSSRIWRGLDDGQGVSNAVAGARATRDEPRTWIVRNSAELTAVNAQSWASSSTSRKTGDFILESVVALAWTWSQAHLITVALEKGHAVHRQA
jgi:hypothetical protein